jgi:uncharacterized protein (TIGR02246 family)
MKVIFRSPLERAAGVVLKWTGITARGLVWLCTIGASPLFGQVIPGMPAEDRSADLARFRARVHADMDSLLQRYETAWGRRDASGLAALFTADAGLATEGRVAVQGRDQIARTFRSVLPRMRWGHFSSRVVDINDDVAYVIGTAELEWATAAKERYRITVPFTLTARRAFPDPWLITWQRFDANVTLPAEVLALAPGAHRVRRADGEVWAGDSLPGAGRISDASAEFIAFTVRGGKREFEFFSRRQVERAEESGAPVLRVVQRTEGRDGVNADTVVVRPGTLAPLRQVTGRGGRGDVVRFEELRLRGMVRSTEGEPKALDLALTDPVFSAAALPELLQALPLAAESYAKLRLFEPRRGVYPVTISIVGSENLALADGRALATWLVWVSADDWRQTVWLAKDTQQVVQMVTPLEGGRERWLVRIYPAEPP